MASSDEPKNPRGAGPVLDPVLADPSLMSRATSGKEVVLPQAPPSTTCWLQHVCPLSSGEMWRIGWRSSSCDAHHAMPTDVRPLDFAPLSPPPRAGRRQRVFSAQGTVDSAHLGEEICRTPLVEASPRPLVDLFCFSLPASDSKP